MASVVTSGVAAAKEMQAKNMYSKGRYIGIIDIYDENDKIDLDQAWRLGVRAILHETSMGLYKKDKAYARRKNEALSKGYLWGAFHLVSGEAIEEQLARFFSIEEGVDPGIAMALDWEPTSHGTMSLEGMRTLIRKFFEAKDFYPILYCDSRVAGISEIVNGDPLLAKCPLWYARPRHGESGLQIPHATWKDYTLWQFDDEKRRFDAPYPTNVLPGADWNSFKGTEQQLRKAWPFRVD